MLIVVRQKSGLGNQLFQYAAGRYYAKQCAADLRIAVEPARSAHSHGVFSRPFLLSHFSISAPFGALSRLDRAMLSGQGWLRTARNLLRRASDVEVFSESVSQRYRFLSSLPLRPGTKTLYLVGYWQTYRLIEAVEEELRSDLAFSTPPERETLAMQHQIKMTPQSVSLHLRRGDYTLAAEGNIALPLSYYMRAISMMESRLKCPTFFIFSDDMAYAKRHLPTGLRAVFVEHNNDFSSHDDLRLMACCENHIIANSTFSWWGAWLNDRRDKIVVAPRHWLRTEESYFPDLLPPDWLLLDTLREASEP